MLVLTYKRKNLPAKVEFVDKGFEIILKVEGNKIQLLLPKEAGKIIKK